MQLQQLQKLNRLSSSRIALQPPPVTPTGQLHRRAPAIEQLHSLPATLLSGSSVRKQTPSSCSSKPWHALRLSAAMQTASAPAATAAIPAGHLRVHWVRKDGRCQGYGLHIWGDAPRTSTDWDRALVPNGSTAQGVYWDLPMNQASNGGLHLGLMVHKGDTKAARAELSLNVADTREVWLAEVEQRAYTEEPDLTNVPAGSLTKQAGHWVNPRSLVWRQPIQDAKGPRQFELHYSKDAKLRITGGGVEGADLSFPLRVVGKSISNKVLGRFPYLYGCSTFELPEDVQTQIPTLVKGQLLISMRAADGEALDATGVQAHGAIDSLFTYDGPLGDWREESSGKRFVSVWSPTAQSMELLHFAAARGGEPEVLPMQSNDLGVWTVERPEAWQGSYYKFRVKVYCPFTQRVEVIEATDPYARSLAANGERVQFLDIEDASLHPPEWLTHPSAPLATWTDISLYELHIRDFSISDSTVPQRYRGKYLAFSREHVNGGTSGGANGASSAGLDHLANLRKAGLNTIHLLPAYDFGSVPERLEEQRNVPEEELLKHGPNSEQQQALIAKVADHDGFNWGYDPVHYGVPEGSYATDTDGPARIVEFRQMVQALHREGFRVVLDVVYNHTFAAGPHDRNSVLDKLVPGYYHRRAEDGDICQSTCCNNTATENAMCERLVIDDIVHWARAYKIDGFRFDIMGHLLVSTMEKIQAALRALTLEKDGVDGPNIYIYGEAWDFGEVMYNQRGRNAGQMNLAGTRLGAFNDRLRDGALGGGPFAGNDEQGLVTGLALQPNGNQVQGGAEEQRQLLLDYTDWVRWSMAGNLRTYSSVAADGKVRTGEQVKTGPLPVAYGLDPVENVPFIGCHDNMTMFDVITEKAAEEVDTEERVRMQGLCLALIAFSQGVPFFHAGDELLRSKSLDRDSYNSGDWFNMLDFSMTDNGFGRGLPPRSKNWDHWERKGRFLSQVERYKPTPAQIQASSQRFQTLLRVRYSSPLFRLPTAEHIQSQVVFHNTGPSQIPGVVIMDVCSSADPSSSGTYDPRFERVLAVVNCSPTSQQLQLPDGWSHAELHPELVAAGGKDERLAACGVEGSTMHVAPRTAAVFVQARQ